MEKNTSKTIYWHPEKKHCSEHLKSNTEINFESVCVSANIAASTDKISVCADFLIRTGFLFYSSRAIYAFFSYFFMCVLIQLSRTSFSIIHVFKKKTKTKKNITKPNIFSLYQIHQKLAGARERVILSQYWWLQRKKQKICVSSRDRSTYRIQNTNTAVKYNYAPCVCVSVQNLPKIAWYVVESLSQNI